MRLYENLRPPRLLFLAGLLLALTACGTLEIRLEYPPTTEAVSTTELARADAPPIQPMTPTPVPDDYMPNSAEPALTPMPVNDYPIPEGLRISYLQEGNVWLWTAASRKPDLLTTGGDIGGPVKISDDGEIVAFVREGELWMVRADGTDERPLLSAEEMDALSATSPELQFSRFEWVPGTHVMAFNTRQFHSGGWILNDDLRLVNADTLEQTFLLPPGEGGQFHYSPDGSQIAVATEGAISLVDADGENRRDEVLTYTPVAPGRLDSFYAEPVWAEDGSALLVAIPAPDSRGADGQGAQDGLTGQSLAVQPTTIWRIPAGGSPATLVTSIDTAPRTASGFVSFSSDLVFVAYAELKQQDGAPSARPEVWLALNRLGTIDRFGFPGLNTFYGWAPGRRQFAISTGSDARQLSILQWSGPTVYSGVLDGASVEDLRWVDGEHYLLVVRQNREAGVEGDSWDLLLGDMQGSSTILASAPDFWQVDFANPSGMSGQ